MKSLLVSIFLCFVSITMYSQTNEVKGTVSDRGGNPLPGVSIVVQNTTNGVTTDFDGNFTITIQSGETLIFSYLGFMTKEIVVDNFNPMQVMLDEDTQSLD